MRAGSLRHVVEIYSAGTTQDSAGEPTPWPGALFASVYADISPISGREAIVAQGVENPISHQIRLRYLEGLVASMRIVYAGRTFNILAVRNIDERDREMVCDCVEGLSDG